MASAVRRLAIPRRAAIQLPSQIRSFSTTRAAFNEANTKLGAPLAQKQPIGGFRGGIFGFLLGFSIAVSYGAYNLLDEYRLASAALQASVEELRISTEKISEHVRRIEAVEKDLKALKEITATKDDLSRVRAELTKLYDGLHFEFLELRTHVWGIQQDLHALAKKDATSIRV